MIKIYALYNPINNTPFYVGATAMDLDKRLSRHTGHYNIINNGYSVAAARAELIREIKSSGMKPEIRLLAEVPLCEADLNEKYFYELFRSDGFDLLQSKHHFIYSKQRLAN